MEHQESVLESEKDPTLAPAPGAGSSTSIEWLRQRQQQLELASYDERLIAGARALHIPLYGV
jgi:hypothetical protein